MATAVLGMRGTGTLAADERPYNWRQGILLMFPNGDAPLTAILSMLSEESTDDAEFRWFEKGLPVRRAIITGAKTANTVATGDDISAADTNAEVYLKLKPDGGSADDYSWIKVGHVLMNQVTEEVFLVIAKTATYVIVRRDVGSKFASNPAVTGDSTTGDTVVIVGSGNSEGADVGDSIAYAPIRHFNYTQIFRTALSVTRTAKKTRLRSDKTGPYREAQREALAIHGQEMELAFLYGEREEITTLSAGDGAAVASVSTGKPLRTTRGVVNWLPTVTTSSVTVHTDIGTLRSGALTEPDFDEFCRLVFQYGSSEKLCFMGGKALNAFNQLAKNKLTLTAVPESSTYGMALVRVTTPFGTLLLKQHPLLTTDAVWTGDMIVIDPAHLKYRYLDDTEFLRNRQGNGVDASTDEFLTEAGLECHWSGATASSAGGLAAVAGPGAHGRLKGVTSFGG